MKQRKVKPFTMWKHFKGSKAFVITVAKHSETGEKLDYLSFVNTKFILILYHD